MMRGMKKLLRGFKDLEQDKSAPDANGWVVKRNGKQIYPDHPAYNETVNSALKAGESATRAGENLLRGAKGLHDDLIQKAGEFDQQNRQRAADRVRQLKEQLDNEQRQRWARIVKGVDDFCNRHDIREDLQADLLHVLRAALTNKDPA